MVTGVCYGRFSFDEMIGDSGLARGGQGGHNAPCSTHEGALNGLPNMKLLGNFYSIVC